MTVENFQTGELERLRNDYMKIGMEPQNRELLFKEIERLKNLKISSGIHCGQAVFKDNDPLLQRVAAFIVGLRQPQNT